MRAAWRAGASLAMLAGFGLVALAQVALVVAVVLWALPALPVRAAGPLLLAGAAAAAGLWAGLRHKAPETGGVPVARHQAPELWAQVAALAGEAGVDAPEELRLTPEPDVRAGRGGRRLYLGLPLLHTLTVDQLRSVVVHELAHFAGFAGPAYRGRLAVQGAAGRWGPVLRAYLRLYLLVDRASARRQELAADAVSVRVAGPVIASATLRELPFAHGAWDFFVNRYVRPGVAAGRVADDPFDGFGRFVEARGAELAELRERDPKHAEETRWDSHPPLAVRLAAMSVAPEREHPVDARAAVVLLPDPASWGRTVREELILDGGLRTGDWDEVTAATVLARQQRLADDVFRAVAARTGREGIPGIGLAELLDLVAAGRLGEVAAELFPAAGRDEVAELFAEPMTELFELAAVRSGVARWRHSWTGPPALTDRAGTPLDLAKAARLALAPWSLDEAREQLAELGVSVWHCAIAELRPRPTGTRVLAAMTLDVAGAPTDVVLLDQGFVLAPPDAASGSGRRRLRALVASAPADTLAARYAFIPFAHVKGGTTGRFQSVRARLLLRGGDPMVLRERFFGGATLERASRDTFLDHLRRLTRKRSGRHGR